MRRILAAVLVLVPFSLAQAVEEQPRRIAVSLAAGESGSKLAPKFSPKGTQLPLELKSHPGLEGTAHLQTRVKLGGGGDANGEAGQLLVFARSAAGKPYDLLYIEGPGGRLAEKPLTIKPQVVREKFWSSFSAQLTATHGAGGAQASEDYPVSLWIVALREDEQPAIVRYSRRGFLSGTVKLAAAEFAVVLSDSDNDAVYGPGDWWGLRTPDGKGDVNRSVGDFAWAGGRAWKLELAGTNGRQGHLVPFDPGLTEAEDLAKRDRLREDRLAARADKPVAFRHDVDAALAAAAGKTPYFLKFETDWCGPCKEMTALVFTAKDVADAAQGVACIVVDGDARADLVEKHQVKGYPTGILFSPAGKEIQRYVGYRSVKETSQFLKSAAR